MPMRMRDKTNTLRTMSLLRMRDKTNVLRTAQIIRMRDAANVLRTVYVSMTVSATPTSVSGTRGTFGGAPVFVTSSPATASASGGTGPYTYAWARISGSTDISADTPAAQVTTFSGSVALSSTISAVFEVTITDANGTTGKAQVSTTLQHVDIS